MPNSHLPKEIRQAINSLAHAHGQSIAAQERITMLREYSELKEQGLTPKEILERLYEGHAYPSSEPSS